MNCTRRRFIRNAAGLIVPVAMGQILRAAPLIMGANKARTSVASAGYLVDERFEGTGTPSGWASTTGTPDFDYTTTPPEGSHGLLLNGSAAAQAATSSSFTAQNELFGYFLMRITALPSGTRDVMRMLVSGAQYSQSKISITSTGQLNITYGNTASTATVSTMSLDTVYHIFWHILKGTGADGNGWVAFTADGTVGTGNALSVRTSMNGTSQIDQLQPYALFTSGSGVNWICDKFLVKATSIGANPV